MNTVSRAQRVSFAPGSDMLRARWRALLASPNRHSLTAVHHLLYQALRGRDWRRGFVPPTNPRKIANGAFFGWGLFRALQDLHDSRREAEILKPFDGLIDQAALDVLRRLIPYRWAYAFKPTDFVTGRFPFDAYEDAGTLRGEAGHDPDVL